MLLATLNHSRFTRSFSQAALNYHSTQCTQLTIHTQALMTTLHKHMSLCAQSKHAVCHVLSLNTAEDMPLLQAKKAYTVVSPQLNQLRIGTLSSQLSTPDSQLSFLEQVLCSSCSALHGLHAFHNCYFMSHYNCISTHHIHIFLSHHMRVG